MRLPEIATLVSRRLLMLGLAALAASSQATGFDSPGRSAAASAPAGQLPGGSSAFRAPLPSGRTIEIFAYRATGHGPDDPIIIVLPGGGRNGDDYRDAWIAAAEDFDLLVLAPSFDENQFPGPINYNLAGMIDDSASIATLGDVTLTPPEAWLFADIEALFDEAVARTNSAQTHYDLFGHSAGGQIVHRMILFAPRTRIGTAIAANSGWYTTPAPDIRFPYGLAGLSMPRGQLEKALGRHLVLFLGERDDADETRGHLRRTPETDAQGAHRLARGRHFHAVAEAERARLGLSARWRLHVVPGVGHDYRAMGAAAAAYLYGRN